MGADDRHLYVSNWGSRSVSVVDTDKNKRVRDITVGLRPNDMTVAPDGRLFVACAGDNTVHVIPTKLLENPGADASPARRLWEGTREIISTSLYPQSPEGSTPVGVAVSPDGRTLFVANADNNSVVVVDISNTISEEARKNRVCLGCRRVHPGRLVSHGAGGQSGQPDALRRQRQRARFAPERAGQDS